MSDDMVPVPRAALLWLFGEAPSPDGKWFGEDAPDPHQMPYRRYWWRSKFRSMIPAISVTIGLPDEQKTLSK